MAIQKNLDGDLERKIGDKAGIEVAGRLAASLNKKRNYVSLDIPFTRNGYPKFFEISEMPHIPSLGMEGIDVIIEFYHNPPKLNGQEYPMYTGGSMEIKLGETYKLPQDVSGIYKKIEIRKEKLTTYD